MTEIQLEICCGSAVDVHVASCMYAHRVELNSALPLGGLTPSYGSVQWALRADIPIFSMIRPRHGGFAYSAADFNTMVADAKQVLRMGVKGIVFGILKKDGGIDTDQCARLRSLTGYPPCVFHRAFDLVPDWRLAIDQLIELGFCRILTSGQRATAVEGMDTLRDMVQYAAGRIEIMPGGGIRPHNVKELVEATGCTSVHASLQHRLTDKSISNASIHFNDLSQPEDAVFQVDPYMVNEMQQILGEMSGHEQREPEPLDSPFYEEDLS